MLLSVGYIDFLLYGVYVRVESVKSGMNGWMVIVVVIMGGQIGNNRRCYGGKKKGDVTKIERGARGIPHWQR